MPTHLVISRLIYLRWLKMTSEWTDEEIALATELHEDECACGRTIWDSLFGGTNVWCEYARAMLKSRPQKEQLPLQFV